MRCEMLLAQEEWLAQKTGTRFRRAIEAGIADAESGELIDGDEVRYPHGGEKAEPGWLNKRLA